MSTRKLALVVAAVLGFGAGIVGYLGLFLASQAGTGAGAVHYLAIIICPPLLLLYRLPGWFFFFVPSLNTVLYVAVWWAAMRLWGKGTPESGMDERKAA